MSQIETLIADDHVMFREGLKRLLSDTPNITVSGEASNGPETVEQIQKNDYDLVILDISMSENMSLETLKEIKRQKPKLPVLVLSVHPEREYGVRAIRAGSSGYLTKCNSSKELINAIEKIAAGGKYITATLAEELAYDCECSASTPAYLSLSDREYEVLSLIVLGNPIEDIANQLSINSRTVYSYRTRILKKTRTKGTIELIRYALQNKLISDIISNNITAKVTAKNQKKMRKITAA